MPEKLRIHRFFTVISNEVLEPRMVLNLIKEIIDKFALLYHFGAHSQALGLPKYSFVHLQMFNVVLRQVST